MMAIRELKVCLLGDTGVGKSSIVCRFVQDHFDHNISPTIGASFMTKTVPCGNELHKFLIWDTAGQERFHSLAPMYYRGSAAAVIVYDITKQDSFHTLKKWVKELKEHGPENIVMAIAGNKCDLSDIRSPDPTFGPPRKWKQWSNQTGEATHASQPAVLLTCGPGSTEPEEARADLLFSAAWPPAWGEVRRWLGFLEDLQRRGRNCPWKKLQKNLPCCHQMAFGA
uniref:VAMP associated protein A n=1 Tax=Canis lupus familiaris TaxID=9615 RepID=A0A8C0Q8U3_CANLF